MLSLINLSVFGNNSVSVFEMLNKTYSQYHFLLKVVIAYPITLGPSPRSIPSAQEIQHGDPNVASAASRDKKTLSPEAGPRTPLLEMAIEQRR